MKLIELLYPPTCPGCDKILSSAEHEVGFCLKCQKKIRLVGRNACMKCGSTVSSDTTEFCQDCRKKTHYFDQAKSVYRYSGAMKPAMYKFKYSNRRCYGRIFASQTVKMYGSWIRKIGVEMIIPIPMYLPKQRKRGYNQAEVYARALSSETGIPVLNEIVRRDCDTAPMKQLNARERVKNLRTAFKLSENVVQFRKVLLVDDIYTTGTTMDTVAELLKTGGIKEVYGLCVCTGEAIDEPVIEGNF